MIFSGAISAASSVCSVSCIRKNLRPGPRARAADQEDWNADRDRRYHLRQPDDLVAFYRTRFLALRPRLAAGVLLSSDAGPSIVPSVKATYMPPWTRTVTLLSRQHLTRWHRSAAPDARLHFASASEQRDGVVFVDGQTDHVSDRRTEPAGGRRRKS